MRHKDQVSDILYSERLTLYPTESQAAKIFTKWLKDHPEYSLDDVDMRIDSYEQEEDHYGNGGGCDRYIRIFKQREKTDSEYDARITKKRLRVLVACEESQTVCKAFRELGHEAYSCDIEDCSGGHPEWHLKQDVLPLLKIEWDLIIAHPPCTYMSKAGARWMYPKAGELSQDRFQKSQEAKEFFMKFYNLDCKHIAIENPVPLKVVGLPKPTQKIQPYEFGEPYSKATLLWLKGLPKLVATNILDNYVPWMPSNTGGFSRGQGGSRGIAHDQRTASKTFEGIAKAMAEQWSNYILDEEK